MLLIGFFLCLFNPFQYPAKADCVLDFEYVFVDSGYSAKEAYEKLNISKEVDFALFHKAYIGFKNLKDRAIVKKDILTLIDYGKSSTEKRLWIFDLKNFKVLENTWVAHGKNSGQDKAIHFSNKPNSLQSSLGFFLTKGTYYGKHGLSLRLEGLDSLYNSNAEKRAIVLHAADYVSAAFIKLYGRLGRSFGCPAVSPKKSKRIIELIKDGSVIFAGDLKCPVESDICTIGSRE